MMRASARTWAAVLAAVMAFVAAWYLLRVPVSGPGLHVDLHLRTTHTAAVTVFWDERGSGYDEGHSVSTVVRPDPEVQRITLDLPREVTQVHGLRIDPADAAVDMDLEAIVLRGPYRQVRLDAFDIPAHFSAVNHLKDLAPDSARRVLPLHMTGNDPYLASMHDLLMLTNEAMDPERPELRPFLLALGIALLVFLLARALLQERRHTTSEAATQVLPRPSRRRVRNALVIAAATGFLTHGVVNNISFEDRALRVEFELVASRPDNFQVFYADKPGAFKEGNFVNQAVKASPLPQVLSFKMPQDTLFSHLRFDPGNAQDSLVIRRMWLRCNDESSVRDAQGVFDLFRANEQVERVVMRGDELVLTFNGPDPFLFCDTDLRSEVKALWVRSGNGPLPMTIAVLAAIFTLLTLLFAAPGSAMATAPARPAEVALTLLFVVMISLPLLSEVMPIEPKLADTEKRPMAEKPLLKLHSLLTFPPRYTKFYSDHFGFRKSLFRLNALFHAFVLRDSPMPDNLVFGKDGFMFLVRPGAIDQYRGLPMFTEQELHWISERLERRRKWLADQGISYYLMFPPLTASVYPDKLPGRMNRIHARGGLDQLIDHLRAHTAIPVIDPRAALIEGRKVRDTYYTTDIHWNPWGGYLGYRELMNTLIKDHPELGSPCLPGDYVVQLDTNDQGDLAMQMALNDVFTRVTPMMAPYAPDRARSLPDETLPASAFFKYRPVFKQGPDPNAPKLLMFRDSFAVYLIPYLSEHFSRSVYVWTPIFIPDIVEKEKPDIVVQEILEVFIRDLLEDKLRDDI